MAFSQRFGGGNYNLTVAAEFRWQRIQESIATNPNFSFISPRYFTAYAESSFPFFFFVDGRKADGQLPMDVARGFFQDSKMPTDFHRANQSITTDLVDEAMGAIFEAHPIQPGGNQGRLNSYTVNTNSANFNTSCKLYSDFVNVTVKGLYPNPTGVLKDALNANLDYFYAPISDPSCPQVFPWGKP
jgi:unspecific peroxygenase